MADTNTYTSKQNIKKYTTQAKFDAIDKSDVPIGTEYNIVGPITESDLDSDLQAKINLTGGGPTYTAGKNIVIDGTTIKTKDDVTFDTAVVNALTVASTGIFTRGPINRVPSINFGTSAEPLSATGLYSFCTVFTTTGNENKTTYGFKIPPVGGVADIRFPKVTYGNLVVQEQLKTLFGNQSLVGTGNIDLYRHKITYANINGDIFGYSTFYSSNNLQCGSLTDLKTLLGDNFNIAVYPTSGYLINNWIPLSLDNSHMMILDITSGATTNIIGYDAFTITDTVTAI